MTERESPEDAPLAEPEDEGEPQEDPEEVE